MQYLGIASILLASVALDVAARSRSSRFRAGVALALEEDTALGINLAEPIIETWIEKNGCTMQTRPSSLLNSICATVESALPTGEYQGCRQGYPVIWCPMPGRPHEIPTWSGNAIATFFQQF